MVCSRRKTSQGIRHCGAEIEAQHPHLHAAAQTRWTWHAFTVCKRQTGCCACLRLPVSHVLEADVLLLHPLLGRRTLLLVVRKGELLSAVDVTLESIRPRHLQGCLQTPKPCDRRIACLRISRAVWESQQHASRSCCTPVCQWQELICIPHKHMCDYISGMKLRLREPFSVCMHQLLVDDTFPYVQTQGTAAWPSLWPSSKPSELTSKVRSLMARPLMRDTVCRSASSSSPRACKHEQEDT